MCMRSSPPVLLSMLLLVFLMAMAPVTAWGQVTDSLFQSPRYFWTFLSSPAWTQGVTAGDFNGDGLADLAAVTREASYLSILLNNGDGTFGTDCYAGCYPDICVPIGQPGIGTVGSAYLNDDVYCDVIIGNESKSVVVGVMNDDSTVTFSAPYTLRGGGFVSTILPADYDGDGDADFVTSVQHWRVYDSTLIAIFRNNGDATFIVDTISLLAHGTVASAADFDNDGDADLLLRSMDILNNNGDGTFASPNSIGTSASDASCADLDGDQDIDIVAVKDSMIITMKNMGDGTFAALDSLLIPPCRPPTYPLPDCVRVVAADFDGDADADVAIQVRDSPESWRYVVAYRNDGNGMLDYAGSYSLGEHDGPPIAFDLSDDGISDLIIPSTMGAGAEYGAVALLCGESVATDVSGADPGS